MNPTHERLFRLTARALNDDELLEVLLDSGALRGEELVSLTRRLEEDWLDDARLSEGQAARLLAALELSRRVQLKPASSRTRLRGPRSIYEYVRPHLLNLAREEMHVLCLGPSSALLRHRIVAHGSTTHCHVDPREVFAPAIGCRAAGIVLVHNHPGGDPQPSAHDVALTRQLQVAAQALCIKVVDHLVLGDACYVSMLSEGLLEARRPDVSDPTVME